MNTSVSDQVYQRLREITAFLLWDLEAVKINIEEPFRLVSGNFSPIYVNCREVISNPTFMELFASFSRTICEHNEITFDVVAGGETAGIPFASYLAQNLSLPMVYVRKATKDYGISSFIEGKLPEDSKVLLVEDLITDAKSKLHFCDAIQASKGIIDNILVVFNRQQGGQEILKDQGINLHSLTDLETTMAIAKEGGIISENDLRAVNEYLQSPHKWHDKHGFSFNN